MARIVFRGLYAAFPMVGLTVGDLAYATDYLQLYSWDGAAWVVYSDYPDYQGEKAGLFPEAEWAAVEGRDRQLIVIGLNVATGGSVNTEYLVAAGRTLYINGVAFSSSAVIAADRDNNQIAEAHLAEFIALGWLTREVIGGNGGGELSLPKPRVFPAGARVRLYVYNWANHNCKLEAVARGYEI